MNGTLPLVAGVELGGTKGIAVLGRGHEILAQRQVPTRSPAETLAALRRSLSEFQEEHGAAEALGIASFGPIRVDPSAADHGCMLSTPKPGWSGAKVLEMLAGAVNGPVLLDTDVNGAALAEGEWGASRGCHAHVYITVGTGIGAGLVMGGRPLHGTLHPEFGHIRVRRRPGDSFPGRCPFHADCLEGLASGPAIAARAGAPAETLPADHPVWEHVASELAEGLATLIMILSPQRIVIGGGVGQGCGFLLPKIVEATSKLLGGYAVVDAPLDEVIVHSALGGQVGPLGSLRLAQLAAAGGRS